MRIVQVGPIPVTLWVSKWLMSYIGEARRGYLTTMHGVEIFYKGCGHVTHR